MPELLLLEDKRIPLAVRPRTATILKGLAFGAADEGDFFLAMHYLTELFFNSTYKYRPRKTKLGTLANLWSVIEKTHPSLCVQDGKKDKVFLLSVINGKRSEKELLETLAEMSTDQTMRYMEAYYIGRASIWVNMILNGAVVFKEYIFRCIENELKGTG